MPHTGTMASTLPLQRHAPPSSTRCRAPRLPLVHSGQVLHDGVLELGRRHRVPEHAMLSTSLHPSTRQQHTRPVSSCITPPEFRGRPSVP